MWRQPFISLLFRKRMWRCISISQHVFMTSVQINRIISQVLPTYRAGWNLFHYFIMRKEIKVIYFAFLIWNKSRNDFTKCISCMWRRLICYIVITLTAAKKAMMFINRTIHSLYSVLYKLIFRNHTLIGYPHV